MSAQFEIKDACPIAVSVLMSEFRLPRFVAATMVSHGVKTIEDARLFLSPDLERDWLNPYTIPGMQEAADRVEAALRAHERILVFGDFDLDGISATTVLTRGLRALDGDACWLIPRRFEEGYGMSEASIARALESKPDLVVSVDCGISNGKEARRFNELGVDVVITDHHEPGESMPECIVCDPKTDPGCKSSILAGVGVALKLVQALGARFGKPNLWRSFTDFAALGTVADLMPLVGENRALVSDGLARMNEHPRPSIAALVGVCNVSGKPLTATNLSFSLIPRLNAAGRMGNADLAAELLMEDGFDAAAEKAARLDAVNDQRRAIEADLAKVALAQAEDIYRGQHALVVSGEGWHEGVKGIVASRLVSKYGVPTILFSIEGDEARGSGRSVGQINLFKAVAQTSDILTRFGGHEAAVGVTLPADKLPEFTERLCAYMDALPESSFHPLLPIDADVRLGELTIDAVEALERLAPFGQENPTPRLIARNVRISNCRAVGAAKNHLSCTLTDGIHHVDGIMFHPAGIEDLISCGCVVDAVFEAQVDEWRGRRKVKAMLQSIEPLALCPAMRACLPADDIEFVGEMYDEFNGDRPAHDVEVDFSPDAEAVQARAYWSRVAADNPDVLVDGIVDTLIGSKSLHESQIRALASLEAGKNTFAVMGTGRGKSLIFQTHAARIALRDGKASLFVYPLRALIADQRFHMAETLQPFGVGVAALTGETDLAERERIYAGIADGSVDIVLTTPEFAHCHAKRLASSGDFGFIAVDEAHHMAERGARRRIAYAGLSSLVEALGNPVVLALTATAPTVVAETADDVLSIDESIFDDTTRPNLLFDDRRGLRDKDSYLASVISSGEKTIVYVNSRVGTVDLARRLRELAPHVAMQIGFYNAGLSRDERERIESLFRDNVLKVLVCTSAFGEGVNIPDVRHVALYGMPFSEIEFNQMSGRAGRDGANACVHALFGRADADACARILSAAAPSHDDMAQAYREVKRATKDAGPKGAVLTDAILGERCGRATLGADACRSALKVFEELELICVDDDADDGMRRVRMNDGAGKVELTDSVYYREGMEERETFSRFRNWAIGASPDDIHGRIVRPILPGTKG